MCKDKRTRCGYGKTEAARFGGRGTVDDKVGKVMRKVLGKAHLSL